MVLEHKFQSLWIEDHIRRSDRCKYEREKKQGTKRLSEVRMNRATLLRAHQVPVDKGELWKMSRFTKKALPHIKTFSTDNQKIKAYEANATERVGRLGINGGGIVVPPYK